MGDGLSIDYRHYSFKKYLGGSCCLWDIIDIRDSSKEDKGNRRGGSSRGHFHIIEGDTSILTYIDDDLLSDKMFCLS